MKYFIAALLLTISTSAFADNIAGCEVVLMEKIAQEGIEGKAEVASFRPAEDFIASIYDDETEVLREIDGLPIRAIMCKRQSVVPSLRDFPIVATGTPFMISQNFDSTSTGLTTVWFKGGKFKHSYKGPDLDEETEAELGDRMEVYNLQPHDLAEKEEAMLKKKAISKAKKVEKHKTETEGDTPEEELIEEVASEDELLGAKKKISKTGKVASEDELVAITKDEGEASSTEELEKMDDSEAESAEENNAANPKMERISKEQHDKIK